MSTATLGSTPQAIPGAETQVERTVVARWPSIASTRIGRGIGALIEAAPELRLPWFNVNIALAPALLLAPIGAVIYLETKLTGAIAPYRNGQEFYQAADVVLLSASGDELLRMEAVTRPGVFRQNILESRDALVQVQEALATIQARGDG